MEECEFEGKYKLTASLGSHFRQANFDCLQAVNIAPVRGSIFRLPVFRLLNW
jgi:hypothetical protein